jgi:CO/xanthine dehydrogenase Mo-binding subunit
VARGIAYAEAFRTHIAHVVELSAVGDSKLKIHRIVCVADCGTTLDPEITRSSLEGGTVWGLGVAFKSAISFRGGRTAQSNWHDYRIPQMDETPPVEVHMIESGARPLGGTGEVGPVTLVPALANAVFAATGKRIRALPLDFSFAWNASGMTLIVSPTLHGRLHDLRPVDGHADGLAHVRVVERGVLGVEVQQHRVAHGGKPVASVRAVLLD